MQAVQSAVQSERQSEETATGASGSEVHLDEWVGPDIADENGLLRAGNILEWMDVVGSLAAARLCRKPVVTASVDGMDLRHPITVGEHVTMTAMVACTTERSIGVSVQVRHGPRREATPKVMHGYMTFVALDGDGKSLRVPQFTPNTPTEQQRFREGRIRREFRRRIEQGQPLASTEGVSKAIAAASDQERPFLIREALKILPLTFRMPWERPDAPKPRKRHYSYVHKIEPVRTARLNFHRTLYGGTLMRWIETAANLSARAYLDGKPVRLRGLHGLTFIRPVTENLFIHIRSVIVHTRDGDLTALVTVHSEDPVGGVSAETLRAFLTFEPVGTGAGQKIVPPLECVGEEEQALFQEVEQRLELQRILRDDTAQES